MAVRYVVAEDVDVSSRKGKELNEMMTLATMMMDDPK